MMTDEFVYALDSCTTPLISNTLSFACATYSSICSFACAIMPDLAVSMGVTPLAAFPLGLLNRSCRVMGFSKLMADIELDRELAEAMCDSCRALLTRLRLTV